MEATLTETSSSQHSEAPLIQFGVITDIQFADCEDALNYQQTRTRYYSKSLQ